MKKINKQKIINILLITIFICIIVYSIGAKIPSTINRQMQNDQKQLIENLSDISQVSQSFVAPDSYMSAINVTINTGDKKNAGKIKFILKDENGNVISSKDFDASSIINKQAFSFKFDPQKDSKGKKYTAYFIGSDLSKGDGVYLYTSDTDSYKNGDLTINNKLANKDLTFSTTFSKTKIMNIKDSLNKLRINDKIFIGLCFLVFISIVVLLYNTLNIFND